MKKLLGVVALAVVGTCCHLNKTADKSSVETSAAAVQVTNAAADTLSVAMLKAYDLSPVLCTLSADPYTIVEPMNGFFGTGHYRI